MNLRETIARQSAPGGVFRRTPDAGGNAWWIDEIAEFYPRGGCEFSQEHVLVDFGHLEGTRENHGDGVTLNRSQGEAVRETVIVDCRPDLPVQKVQPKNKEDIWRLFIGTPHEAFYVVKRINGIDHAELSLVCVRTEHQLIRYSRRGG